MWVLKAKGLATHLPETEKQRPLLNVIEKRKNLVLCIKIIKNLEVAFLSGINLTQNINNHL